MAEEEREEGTLLLEEKKEHISYFIIFPYLAHSLQRKGRKTTVIIPPTYIVKQGGLNFFIKGKTTSE